MAEHHFNISTYSLKYSFLQTVMYLLMGSALFSVAIMETLVTTSSIGLEFTLPVVLVVFRKLILPIEMLELMLPLM